MKKTTLIVLLLLFCSSSYGQWQSINPGAGGQVQDVVGDPNIDGRLILASDMEGIYESLDHGESWHVKGILHQNRAYAVAFAPGNINKLYVGTLYGLEVSSDGGNTFSLITETKRKSIGAIAVDPNNENIVIAGIGWRDDYDFSDTFGLKENANGELYRSEDGGVTWTMINFDMDAASDRNVFSIQFDAANGNNVYIGTGKGVFKSTDAGITWIKISSPAGTIKNKGISLSPDGKIIYASYTTSGRDGHVYVSPTSTIAWQQVTAGSGEVLGVQSFWYPEVDPRSTAGEHKLTVALEGSRAGLFEATFNWTGETLNYYSWKTIWQGTEGYDNGWDNAAPNPRYVHYTPSSWDRAIWSTTNQTIFQGKPNGSEYIWHNKYSMPNHTIKVSQWNTEWPTYSGRGTESTYSYDIAVHDNYVVQGQGDNGAMESWDYGFSWSNIQHRLVGPPLADVQAVDIADAYGTPLVVAQMTSGYGGNALNGQLYAKKLNSHSPEDTWLFLAGNWKGLPSGVLRDIAVSPAKPSRVFAHSTNNGIWMMDDIGWAYSEAEAGRNAWWTRIDEDNAVTAGMYAVKKIAPHPTNEDIIYMNGTGGGNQGVFRGEKIADAWVWTKIYNGSGWDSEINVWEHNGQVYLFYSGASSEAGGDGNNFIGALSMDDGATWQVVINKETAKSLTTHSWYDNISEDFGFRSKGGSVGYQNQIIINYYDHRQQKTYGIYKGIIDGSGDVAWEDFTANIPFGGLTSAIVRDFQGEPYLYATTAGAGAWRRPMGASSVTIPIAVTDLSISEIVGTTIHLTWTDSAGNEDGYRIERKVGDTYITVATLDPDTTSFSDENLEALTEYSYRIKAFNIAGISNASNTITGTTAERIIVCKNPNLIANPEFDDAANNWDLYTNAESVPVSAATLNVVTDAALSGVNAAKVSITTIGGTTDTDIQFNSNLPELIGGKTYQVSFKAKADTNKPIRFQILLGEAPWTGYLTENVTVTNETITYGPYEFTVGTSTSAARIGFYLSNDTTDIWFDAIEVQETCGAPNAPTELNAIGFSAEQIDLAWTDNSEDETGFIIEQKTDGNFEVIATLDANATSYSVTGLEATTEYTFRVLAQNDFGDSTYSNESIASTTKVGACTSSNLLKNAEFDSGIDDWEFYDNTGSSATAEVVTNANMSGANTVKINIPSVGGTTDSDIQFFQNLPNLQNGLTYEITFSAKASAAKDIRLGVLLGQAPWTGFMSENISLTNQVATYGPYELTMGQDTDAARLDFFLSNDDNDVWLDAVVFKQKCSSGPPISPTNLVATSVSSSQIDLSWEDNADNETSFVIERKSDGDYEVIHTTGSNSTSYSDSGLEGGTAYTYRLTAKNSDGDSDYSNENTATTSEGCNTKDFIRDGEFNSGTADWTTLIETGNTATFEEDTNSELSGNKSVKVTIETTAGSDNLIQFYQSGLPTLEAGVTYELSFMAKASATKAIRIAVLRGEAPWNNFLVENLDITTDATSYGPYEFIMSDDSSISQFHFFLGNDTNDIWIDAVVLKEKCDIVLPNAPTELMATSASSNEIDLTWTDNADNEEGFVIEQLINGNYESVANVGPDVASYTIGSLMSATAYTFRVAAKNAAGNSEYSNETSATTSAGSNSGCDFPNFIADGEYNFGVSDWISYFDTAAPASGSITPDTNSVLSGVNSAKISITATNGGDNEVQFYQSGLPTLEAGKTYELTFKAKADGSKPIRIAVLRGESPWNNFLEQEITIESDVATYGPYEFTMAEESTVSQFHFFLGKDNTDIWLDAVVLKEKCDLVAPDAPSNLAASVISADQIDLTWTDNSDNESGFTIERKTDGDFIEIATLSAAVTSYSNTGLAGVTTYTYRVKAINPDGVSEWSNESAATTLDGGGNLGCTNPNLIKDGEFLSGTADWIPYNDTSGTVAFDEDSNSELSGEKSVKVTIETAGASDSDIQFYQQGLPTLVNGVTYELSFMAKATTTKSIRVAVLRGESPWNNFLVKNLDITTEAAMYGPYEFTMTEDSDISQFHFFLGNDNNDIWLDAVILQEKCEITTAPLAPTNLEATAATGFQIDLTWTDSDNAETGFVVERKSDGDFEVIVTLDATTTMYSSTGLVPETTYTYRVKAINDIGDSSYSNESEATTLQEDGIPYNNFDLELIGETCPGKSNGQIIIDAQLLLNYETTIDGVFYTFTDVLTTNDLAPGSYDFCITVVGENYEVCYTVQIGSGTTISGKSSSKKGKVAFNINEGTAPFKVSLNGEAVLETSSQTFTVNANHGDTVIVKTSVACEGVMKEKINLNGILRGYPNPTKGLFELALPISKKEVQVDLYNIHAQLILSKVIPVVNGIIQLNIEDKPSGVYLLRIPLENPIHFKITKQ